MDQTSPLHSIQDDAEATFMPYGPAEAGVRVVESFSSFEAEYAAVRKGVGLFDMPQRGVVMVSGADRLDFLHRFVTNDTNGPVPGQGRQAFLLNRQGRISADLIVLAADDTVLLDLDVFGAQDVSDELERFVFTEDVQLHNATDQWAHQALHGPAAAALLAAVAPAFDASKLEMLGPLSHLRMPIERYDCVVYRRDETGAPGFHLIVPRQGAAAVYGVLVEALGGLVPAVEGGLKRAITGRGIGWLAYNTARIEAGTPIFHVDFGPDSLPHETGILDHAVSFTKGCYLGQEVVARMQSLGHPKRVLVGLKCEGDTLPVAGAGVLAAGDTNTVIGAVTSSTLAPLLGGTAIALAMIKWGQHKVGTAVLVQAEGRRVGAKVQGLGFI